MVYVVVVKDIWEGRWHQGMRSQSAMSAKNASSFCSSTRWRHCAYTTTCFLALILSKHYVVLLIPLLLTFSKRLVNLVHVFAPL